MGKTIDKAEVEAVNLEPKLWTISEIQELYGMSRGWAVDQKNWIRRAYFWFQDSLFTGDETLTDAGFERLQRFVDDTCRVTLKRDRKGQLKPMENRPKYQKSDWIIDLWTRQGKLDEALSQDWLAEWNPVVYQRVEKLVEKQVELQSRSSGRNGRNDRQMTGEMTGEIPVLEAEIVSLIPVNRSPMLERQEQWEERREQNTLVLQTNAGMVGDNFLSRLDEGLDLLLSQAEQKFDAKINDFLSRQDEKLKGLGLGRQQPGK